MKPRQVPERGLCRDRSLLYSSSKRWRESSLSFRHNKSQLDDGILAYVDTIRLSLEWDNATSSQDVKLLILLRFVRLLGYGGTTFILALYLSALGFRDSDVGLLMTLTLVGDLGISFVLTYVGDRMGVRLTAMVGALLMCAGGLAFPWLDNFWLLLLASVAGGLAFAANEIDPFKAIEESAIARLSAPDARSDVFAWWSMLGMLGTAASNLATGWALDALRDAGTPAVDCYRLVFVAYATMGLVKLACAACLSTDAEPTKPPMFTPASFSFMWKLSLAMAFDFIRSGLAQISWMTYYFKREYDVPEGALGSATFAAGIISSVLNLASSPLARTIGQVQTMVVCHTINSASLLMVAVPADKDLALAIFLFRIVTREMDNASRQAFISAGLVDAERTSAMGVVNIIKTVGSCLGLYMTGLFAGLDLFWLAFIVAGALKLVYNVLISAFFWRRGQKQHAVYAS
ncbi:major facilitator superfamily domain-containing protein [Lasiosphaeris hirsuta]|uniref:Major facilitator superfamily domain-containing protein n=1 Tax=Lasiosphaeris hirsuta TaxID=260670 RepID=A0AA40BCW6_9PEZI|nr:major facilitator superfamily domain-containing protein [Lasiosphaeris hirsuta]